MEGFGSPDSPDNQKDGDYVPLENSAPTQLEKSPLTLRSRKSRRVKLAPLQMKPTTGLTMSQPSPFDLKPWSADIDKSFAEDPQTQQDFQRYVSYRGQAICSLPTGYRNSL